MTISDLEEQKDICELFVYGFETIVSSNKSSFEVLSEAKSNSLQKCIVENLDDLKKSEMIQRQIKRYYLSKEYEFFLKAYEDNSFSSSVLHNVRIGVTSKGRRRYFGPLGITPEFENDPKAFFANYKIASRKISELENLITIEQKNRGKIL